MKIFRNNKAEFFKFVAKMTTAFLAFNYNFGICFKENL